MASVKLFFILFSIAITTSLQFGYHTGVINAPLILISDFIGNVSANRNGPTDPNYIRTIESFCVSGFLIGGMIGALVSGSLANKFGRKKSIILLSIPCIAGGIMLMLCKMAESFEMIIIGRLFIGLACGAYTGIGPLYMFELAPSSIRGAAGVLNQIVIVASLLMSQILALPSLMGTDALWPYLLGLNILPCLLGTVCLFFCPESPRYMYLVRNDSTAAREALMQLRDSTEDIQLDLDDYVKEAHNRTTKASILDLLKVPYLRLALVVSVIAQLGQQLSSMSGLLYYSTKLFKANGLSEDSATYATIGIGGVLLAVTIVSVFIIDRLGRRVLLIGGFIDALVSLVIFTVCLIIRKYTEAGWLVYPAIVAIYLFVCGFGIGPGSIPWFIVAELFSQETRDAALSVAVTSNWACNIAMGLGFIHLINYIGLYSFLPSIGILLLVILLLYFYLPETMNRDIGTIKAEFRRLTGTVEVNTSKTNFNL